MVSTDRRRWVSFVVLVVAGLAVIATSQPRWSISHKQGGVVSLPAGQKAARFALTADASHALTLSLRFSPSFTEAKGSGASIRAIVAPRALPHPAQEARMSDTLEAGVFEAAGVRFHQVSATRPSHADFDVVIERLSGEQALTIAWDAEAETGERGDSTVPKSAFVRVVESPLASP